MTDYLSEARSALEEQLKSLGEQQKRVERALRELGGEVRRGPGRPRGSGRKPSRRGGSTKQRRRRRGGTRRDQALKLVQANPGIEVGELAKQLKIKPNYLYRVMGELGDEGLVEKRGSGFVAK